MKKIPQNENYSITRDGQVWSHFSNRYMKLSKSTFGYLRCKVQGKDLMVHRAVAQTYLPNPDNLPEVAHLNRNKTDNRVENLRWMSISEHRRMDKSTLTTIDAYAIKRMYASGLYTQKYLGQFFGVSRDVIANIVNRRTWK